MTTTYYISYQVRKSNGVSAWYCTKNNGRFVAIEEKYNELCERKNVRAINLWQKDHYEQNELAETFRNKYPHGSDSFKVLKRYDRI